MTAAVRRIHGLVPPNDLDAEAAVLSAIMLDAGAADVAMSTLAGSSFYSPANRTIFEAARTLFERRCPIDVLSIASQLSSSNALDRAGGKTYLGQIVDATPAVTHLEAHCEIVVDRARQREVIAAAHAIVAEGYGDVSEVSEWLGQVEARVMAATSQRRKDRTSSLREILGQVWDELSQGDNARPSEDRVDTGLVEYDEFSGGIYRGDLIVVAARPGMGKSALAQCWCRNVAEQGQHVILFSVEMPRRQVSHRLLAQHSGVELRKIRDRWRYPFEDSEWEQVVSAYEHLSRLPITIDDTPGIMIPELRSKARRAASKAAREGARLGLVVVDYLQRLGRGRSARTREEEVAAQSAALKDLAMELHVPVVALAQLNRALEARPQGQRRPGLADLRESGAIEQDADQVLFVYRESYYSTKASSRDAELIIGKNRNGGEAGTVELGWHGWCTRFVDRRDR